MVHPNARPPAWDALGLLEDPRHPFVRPRSLLVSLNG